MDRSYVRRGGPGAVASQCGVLLGETFVRTDTPAAEFIAPIVSAATLVERVLAVLRKRGRWLIADKNEFSFLRSSAARLRDRIAKTFRLGFGGVLLPVEEVDLGNLTPEQNAAAHELFACANQLVVNRTTQIDAGEAERFHRNLEVLRDSLAIGNYSVARSPDEWEAIFGVSWRTLKRRIASKQLHAIEVSSKSWRILKAEIPPAKRH